LTGVVPGQGGWLTRVPAAGLNSDFQVVNQGGTYGNVIQITGSSTGANSRFMSKTIADNWTNRDLGNDILEVEFNLYSGPASASANTIRVVVYNSDFTQMLSGIMLNMGTKVLSGLSYYDNTAATGGTIGNYAFRLLTTGGATPSYSDLVLTADTWYRLGFSFNLATGEARFKELNGLITNQSIMGAAANSNPDKVYLLNSFGATTNTVSSIGIFDNVNVRATSTDTLLGLVENNAITSLFSVYPNPSKSIINIGNTSDAMLSSIEMTDINGRVVKSVKLSNVVDAQINIAELAQGVYMMKIVSDKGIVTKKVIKE